MITVRVLPKNLPDTGLWNLMIEDGERSLLLDVIVYGARGYDGMWHMIHHPTTCESLQDLLSKWLNKENL